MPKLTLYLYCFVLFIITDSSLAQQYPFKFGKPSLEDLKKTTCDFYPEASSMVLAEKGYLRFEYNNSKGWRYTLTSQIRKKIFKKTDVDQGTVRIFVYNPINSNYEESIFSFKGYSYNLEENKIVKEKINSREFNKRRVNDYFVEVNYPIPNIKSGTVIEYEYNLKSDYLNNLRTWTFQQDIPVAYSEFTYTIPEWFHYQNNQLGNSIQGQWTSETVQEKFTIRYKTDIDPSGSLKKTVYESFDLESNSIKKKGGFRNIPPIKDEPFLTNEVDIPSRLEFQLNTVKFPHSKIEHIAGDYESFNKDLLEDSELGERLNKGNFIKDKIAGIEKMELLEKSNAIFKHLQNHFSWNKQHRYFSSNSGRSAYNKKEGSVADINLSLIAALRHFDIPAVPIILSTRGHGTIHPFYSNYEEFNYLIAGIEIDGKMFLMDASSNLPFGHLPEKCRNGKGWIVDKQKSGWIDLKKDSKYDVMTLLNYEIQEDTLTVNVSQQRKNYAGFKKMNALKQTTTEAFKGNLEDRYLDYEVQNLKVSPLNYHKPLNISFTLKKALDDADLIYIQPILLGSILENPFSREVRDAPIDFAYQQNLKVISTIKIPNGYTMELPESKIIKLPDDAAGFRFIVKGAENLIGVRSELKIKSTFLLSSIYPLVKEFYENVALNNNELIVLKK